MLSEALFQRINSLPPDLKDIFIIFAGEIEEKTVGAFREDFSHLKNIVGELAKAQQRTENRLEQLTVRVDQLAEAQQRTENRLEQLTVRVDQLAEAQKRTENRLEQLAEAQQRTENRLDQLAEAQKRTENRLEQLAEAQQRTENRLEQLAEAQKRTEKSLKQLAEAQKQTEKTVKDVKKQLGGLSMAVGYGLEDKIIPYMFDFGKKEFGVDVTSVERKYVFYPNGQHDEINIYAEGTKDGRPAFIFGECKAQPGKKDMARFAKLGERLKDVVHGDHYFFMAGHQLHPDVEIYAAEKFPHIHLYKSYHFELNYRKRRVE